MKFGVFFEKMGFGVFVSYKHPTPPSRSPLYLPCGRYGFRISEIWVSQKNKVPLFLLKKTGKIP